MAVNEVTSFIREGIVYNVGADTLDNTPLIVGSAQDGSSSSVTADAGNTTDWTVSVDSSSNPTSDLSIVVVFTTAGGFGTGAFKLSRDGGDTFTSDDAYTLPTATTTGTVDVGDGLILAFTTNTTNPAAGDTFTLTTIGGMATLKPILVSGDTYLDIVRSGELKDNLDEFFTSEIIGYGSPRKAYIIRPENNVAGSIGAVEENKSSEVIYVSGLGTNVTGFELTSFTGISAGSTTQIDFTLIGTTLALSTDSGSTFGTAVDISTLTTGDTVTLEDNAATASVVLTRNSSALPVADQSDTLVFADTSDGSIAISGTPARGMDLIVKIVLVSGDGGTAKYQYSIDGGETYSDVFTTPTTGGTAYIGYGITLTFTDGTSGQSFTVNDTYSSTITAPRSSNNLLALTDSLTSPVLRNGILYFGKFTYFTILGSPNDGNTEIDQYNIMKTLLTQRERNGAGFLGWAILGVQSRQESAKTVQSWVNDLVNQGRPVFTDRRITVCPYQLQTPTASSISGVIILSAAYAVLPVNRYASRKGNGALTNVDGIIDQDALRPYEANLVDAGYTILNEPPDFPNQFYFLRDRIMSSPTSDFKTTPDNRVATKVANLARKYSFSRINDDIEALEGSIAGIVSDINTKILTDMQGEITDLESSSPTTLTELAATKELKLIHVINRRIVIETITNETSYAAV